MTPAPIPPTASPPTPQPVSPAPSQPGPPPPSPSLRTPPVQPALFTAIGNGFLVYCGLIVAGAASLLASVDKVVAPDGLRTALGAAAGFGLLAGVFALWVMAATHNHARRAERTDTTDEQIDAARLATIRWATATMAATMASALCLAVGLWLFVRAPSAPPPVLTLPPISVQVQTPAPPRPQVQPPAPEPAVQPTPFVK